MSQPFHLFRNIDLLGAEKNHITHAYQSRTCIVDYNRLDFERWMYGRFKGQI